MLLMMGMPWILASRMRMSTALLGYIIGEPRGSDAHISGEHMRDRTVYITGEHIPRSLDTPLALDFPTYHTCREQGAGSREQGAQIPYRVGYAVDRAGQGRAPAHRTGAPH